MSFSIKSSHKYVKPPVETESVVDTFYSTSSSYKPSTVPKGSTNTDSDRREGSNNGMVVRTTNTSVEDYY